MPANLYEAGQNERVTLIEFDSLKQAIATRKGAAYQAAFAKLGNVVRDVRVMEGFNPTFPGFSGPVGLWSAC